MNFVAIDFETANEQRSSACSLGIVVIKNGICTESKSWLIRPNELRFNELNIWINGIYPEDVANAPEFNELWPEIEHYFASDIIIAHNASFDISVLRAVLNQYSIPFPQTDYFCSWKTAKKVWPGLLSYRLENIAEFLGIDFLHHKAEQDAYACASIIREACSKMNCLTIPELASAIECNLAKIDSPFNTKYNYHREHVCYREIIPQNKGFDPNHPLYDKVVVFTGSLHSMPRKNAVQKVVDIGGRCASSVINETNYLVIGELDYKVLKDGIKSNKIKKAESLLCQGKSIEMLTESDFLRMIDNNI